ncbi:RING-box protein 2 [Bagarius yarrelli]|uniref:RING-box protein 2 n=1 Tax=Bagarius yarrelli TaxID=175774 RepID=A0A556TQH5_BAGYA|nr:RING-box protein 2 [Bagarius yarrelli]
MAEMDDGDELGLVHTHSGTASSSKSGGDKMFSLKKWNAVAMWSWDVECDTCAICRVQVMDACLRCQAENKQEDCVVVWGECNHSFHNCCMSLWVKQNNRCPLCQQDWVVQRIGKSIWLDTEQVFLFVLHGLGQHLSHAVKVPPSPVESLGQGMLCALAELSVLELHLAPFATYSVILSLVEEGMDEYSLRLSR